MEEKKPQSNRSSVVVLISFLVIIAIAYFFIYPTITSIKELNIKIDATNKESSEIESNLSSLKSLQSQFAETSEQAKKLGLAIPNTDQMPEILVQVETIANGSALKVSSVQPGKEGTEEGVSIPVNISLQGDYKGFTNFISLLEKNIRPMTIKAINIASAAKEEGSQLNFTLNVEALKVK